MVKTLAVSSVGRREKSKTTDKVHGCSEGGHAQGWCDRAKMLGIV